MNKSVLLAGLQVCLVLGLLVAPASAVSMTGLEIKAGWAGSEVDLDLTAWGHHTNGGGQHGRLNWWWNTENGDSAWNGSGANDGLVIEMMNMELDPDPGIAQASSVMNDTAVEKTFVFSVTLPITLPVPAPGTMSGGSDLTLADSDFDGEGVMSANGTPIYKAFIDSDLQKTLFDDPYDLSFNGESAGFTKDDNMNFANENTTFSLDTSLTLRHEFNVSPGETVTFNSTFFVIPEPMTLSLLGLGSLAVLRRRKA